MKPAKFFRKGHKWLALVVGLQLLFWTLSGLFMSAVPIENIKSEHLEKKPTLQVLSPGVPYFAIENVLSLFEESFSVIGVKLGSLLGAPVYYVETSNKQFHLVDALSGKIISPLPKEKAIEIAKSRFTESSNNVIATWVEKPVSEYKGKYPVWRIDFNNFESTSFYVSPETGQLKAKRGLFWRIYDFLWMLHIMDYKNRTDFNNWLLIFAATLGLLASVSGLVLIKYSFKKKDFKFLKRRK